MPQIFLSEGEDAHFDDGREDRDAYQRGYIDGQEEGFMFGVKAAVELAKNKKKELKEVKNE